MSKAAWKDYLLKSGMPFESEIKKYLDEKGCLCNFDYSYFRASEDNSVKEFSYDIDAAYIKANSFFELMIECKYRNESTQWIFIPEEYNGYNAIGHNSFLHPNDHFTQKNSFDRNISIKEPFAPLCSKGVEVLSTSMNNKTITQAISQLSYALAEKYVSGMENQFDKLSTFRETIFYHIPIIVTSAKLYRLKESVGIQQIKDSKEISNIAVMEDCLVLTNTTNLSLENHNRNIFTNFINKHKRENLNRKLQSFNEDISYITAILSRDYCPQSLIVVNHSEESSGFEKIFRMLDEIINSKNTLLKKKLRTEKKIITGEDVLKNLKRG